MLIIYIRVKEVKRRELGPFDRFASLTFIKAYIIRFLSRAFFSTSLISKRAMLIKYYKYIYNSVLNIILKIVTTPVTCSHILYPEHHVLPAV